MIIAHQDNNTGFLRIYKACEIASFLTMTMKPIYRFALLNNAGQYLFNDNRSIGVSDTPVYVGEMLSWKEWAYSLKRHERLFGVYQYYKPETVMFTGDIETILRLMFNRGELLAGGYLLVQELDLSTMTYTAGDKFQLDWEKYAAKELWVEIMIIHGGAAEAITGYEDTVYEIPLPDTSDIVHMDGVVMQGTYTWETQAPIDGVRDSITIDTTMGPSPAWSRTFALGYLDHEGALSPGDPKQTVTPEVTPGPGGDFAGGWLYKSLFDTGATTLSMDDTNFTWDVPDHPSYAMRFRLQLVFSIYDNDWDSGGTELLTGTLWQGDWQDQSTDSVNEIIAFYYSIGAPILAGQYLLVYFRIQAESGIESESSGTIYMPVVPAKLFLIHNSRLAATPCRAMRAKDLFYAICNQIPGYARDGSSNLLGSSTEVFGLAGTNLFYTCTDALRQIYLDANGATKDPVIKKSLNSLRKDLNAVLGTVGIGVEGDGSGIEVIKLEQKGYFYDADTRVASIDSYSEDYSIYPWNDARGGNMTFGYKEQTYDAANGRYEFNQPRVFRSNITYKMPDVDYTADSRADPYGIEVLRANLSNKKTTDSESDNDVIMLACKNTPNDDGRYHLKRSVPIDYGLPAEVIDSIYNVELSPKQCMLRATRDLTTLYGGSQWSMLGVNPVLTFSTGTKNTDLKWIDMSGPFPVYWKERADYQLDGVRPYHACRKIKIEVEVDRDTFTTIVSNPYGFITLRKFKYKGDVFDLALFVDDIQRQPGTEHTYLLEGTLHAENEWPTDF